MRPVPSIYKENQLKFPVSLEYELVAVGDGGLLRMGGSGRHECEHGSGVSKVESSNQGTPTEDY
jgi:hypothetical protein